MLIPAREQESEQTGVSTSTYPDEEVHKKILEGRAFHFSLVRFRPVWARTLTAIEVQYRVTLFFLSIKDWLRSVLDLSYSTR